MQQVARLLLLYENGDDVDKLKDCAEISKTIKERLRTTAHTVVTVGLQDLLRISPSPDLKIMLNAWVAVKPQHEP